VFACNHSFGSLTYIYHPTLTHRLFYVCCIRTHRTHYFLSCSVSSKRSWRISQAVLSSVLPSRHALSRGRNMSSYPPHTVLEMPALSPTMTTGNIATFKFKIGDKV